MKNVLKTAVVGAIAAVFVASLAIAQGTGGQGPGQRLGRGPGFGGPSGPGGRALGPVVMRELTDQQREQVRAILSEQREQGLPADAKPRRDLEAELLADVPNEARIEELKQQVLAAQAEHLTRHIAVQKRIAQVLTAEQRAKARERLSQGPPQNGRRRGVGF